MSSSWILFVECVTVSHGCADVRAGDRRVGWAARQGPGKKTPELPPAVAQAVQKNVPGAEIDKLEVEKEAGINLYEIEFKAGKGEIEVAEDGTVMDVATIVQIKDLPKPAADALQKATAGAKITQLEKSEVRAEIRKQGEKGSVEKLARPKYVYEAELAKGDQTGEVQVAEDGKIVEGPKWAAKGAKPKD